VWDYLFLNSFSSAAAVNVCLSIMNLLKPYLNNAETFTQVRNQEGPGQMRWEIFNPQA
jgi:hypothetical protein